MERLDANTLLAATVGTAIVIGILINDDTKPQPQPQPQTPSKNNEANQINRNHLPGINPSNLDVRGN